MVVLDIALNETTAPGLMLKVVVPLIFHVMLLIITDVILTGIFPAFLTVMYKVYEFVSFTITGVPSISKAPCLLAEVPRLYIHVITTLAIAIDAIINKTATIGPDISPFLF